MRSARSSNAWLVCSIAVIACGAEFTASGESGSGGSSGSPNPADAATGGSSGASGGSNGAAGAQGAGTGAAGSSQGGRGGSTGASGQGGASGSAGTSGTGGGSSGSSADASSDSTPCAPQNTVDSCGPRCEGCTAPDDRSVPTCDGVSCGFACKNSDLKCSDDSCSRLTWSFDSGLLDGIVQTASGGSPLAVRSFDGGPALAAGVTQLNSIPEVSFTLPICISGGADVRSRALTFRVYFDGPGDTSLQYWVQASLPDPRSGAFLGQITTGTGAWYTYAAALSQSTFAGAATTITIQAGSLGASFAGSIWFDDFRIQ